MWRLTRLLVAAALCAAAVCAVAQPTAKVAQVAFLSNQSRPADGRVPEALRKALQDLGYVEGRNLAFEARWSETKAERLPSLAKELLATNPDVIIALGAPAVISAKEASASVPIVMMGAGDAAAIGLVGSLAYPGGNLTGITDPAAELSAKRLELLKAVMSGGSRIAVLWNAGDRAMTHRYSEVEKAAGVLHLKIEPVGVRGPDDFDKAFATMASQRPDAIFVVTDALTNMNRKRVLDFAAEHRIPAIYELRLYVRDGGLISYGPVADDSFRKLAVYVDRILKGAKPSDLPVEQPTKYELVINSKTAQALGLSIPPSVMLRVDEVIP